MHEDANEIVRSYDKYKRFAKVTHMPLEKVTVMSSPWPFVVWEVNLIGSMLTSRGRAKYAIVVVDCFTK